MSPLFKYHTKDVNGMNKDGVERFESKKNYMWDEKIVSSWGDLLGVFDKFSSQWIFRGQPVGFWSLSSSIDRKKELNGWGWESVEVSCLLEYFKKNVSKEFLKYFNPQSNLDWLSLIQHYGGVTGLLDWTTCPYIASFFAFNDGISKKEIEGRFSKWRYINADYLLEQFFENLEKKVLINEGNNFICKDQFEDAVKTSALDKDVKNNLLELKYCAIWAVNQQWLKERTHSRIRSVSSVSNLSIDDIIKPENFDKLFIKSPDLLNFMFVLPVCPDFKKSNFLNERMNAQKGLFLRQSDTTDSFVNNLIFEGKDNYPLEDERKTNIKKFLIPKTKKLRLEILSVLKKEKEINKKLIFPGKDIFKDKCERILENFKRFMSSRLIE